MDEIQIINSIFKVENIGELLFVFTHIVALLGPSKYRHVASVINHIVGNYGATDNRIKVK